MSRFGCLALLLLSMTSRAGTADAPADRVILISVDGLASTVVEERLPPVITGMLNAGIGTLDARTILPPKTRPGHASMLTGVDPAVHGVIENGPYSRQGVRVPTIIDRLEAADPDFRTAAVVGKRKLEDLVSMRGRDGVDTYRGPRPGEWLLPWKWDRFLMRILAYQPAVELEDEILEVIDEEDPHFLFVHFSDVDFYGHLIGWNGNRQGRALATIDRIIGRTISALEERDPGLERSVVILSADHGGQGKKHGEWPKGVPLEELREEDFPPEDLRIPWIAYGAPADALELPERPSVKGTPDAVLALLGVGDST